MKYALQTYNSYSILSGIGDPEEWARKSKELGYNFLGVCNKGVMGDHIAFQQACDKHDIKPIFGVELQVVDDVKNKKESKQLGVVLVYAKNLEGYKNLVSLFNFSEKRLDDGGGYYYKPRVDLFALDRYSEEVICVSPGPVGVGTRMTPTGQLNDVEYLFTLQNSFGEDFYLGYNPFAEESSEDGRFAKIVHAQEFSKHFKLVPVSNSHVYDKDLQYLYETVRKVDRSRTRGKFNLERDLSNFAIPSPEDFQEVDTSCLEEIALKCSLRIPTGTFFMPEPKVRLGLKDDIFQIIGENWKKKFDPEATFEVLHNLSDLACSDEKKPFEHIAKGEAPETLKNLSEYRKRLVAEFEVIEKLGYLNYFHVVEDFCRFIDEMFPTGRGFARGSAAGSLFTYLLNITSGVDPIRHELSFARFLNVDRQDMPDIDVDFSSEARAEVFEYLKRKYGEERVARIGSWSKLKIANGLELLLSAYGGGFPDNDGNIVTYDKRYLTNILDSHVKQTSRGRAELEERLEFEPFRLFYELHSDWLEKHLMPLQEAIVGTGVHAGGAVILNEDLSSVVPCTFSGKYGAVTQFDKVDIEKRGFPKFDLLVIKGPDIVSHTKKLVKARRGEDIVDIEHLPLDDRRTLMLFNKAKTDGIFQFKTWTAVNFLKTLRPTKFSHLVASVALTRPGPMENNTHIEYADRKNGRKPVVYEHPDLEPILDETYGLLVYQEQMMRVCTDIAGMTGPQSDYVRKACGKKKMKEMVKWEQVFKNGCANNGYSEELSDSLWAQIVAFAEYSFNKSHAAAYALLGYYQAYVRSRYTIEYWCSALKYAPDSRKADNNIYQLRDEAVMEGIRFVFPNIYGFAKDFFPADDSSVYWPLRAIKGVGVSVMDSMCPDMSNSYEDFDDMMESIDHNKVNKGTIKTLIKAGFFDPIGPPWQAIDLYNSWRKDNKKSVIDTYDMSHRDMIEWQKLQNDMFGLQVRSWKSVANFRKNIGMMTKEEFERVPTGELLFVGGLVDSMTIKQDKKGGWYCKMVLTDLLEEYRVMVWSSVWEREMEHRPRKGDLVEFVGVKDCWSPPDSDRVFHSIHTKADSYFKVVN